jgi:hypothetical protein
MMGQGGADMAYFGQFWNKRWRLAKTLIRIGGFLKRINFLADCEDVIFSNRLLRHEVV